MDRIDVQDLPRLCVPNYSKLRHITHSLSIMLYADVASWLGCSTGEETKARGAELIVITDKAELAEGLDDNPLIIPNNGPLTGLGAILPLQLIAYELAILR
jgi:glucosamine 6-phosphate synthetase-like amidotransferase/phosphosugar isomerase protein